MSKSSGTVKIYVNGLLQGKTTFTVGTDASEYGVAALWRIGVANPSGSLKYFMNGSIDEIRVYNTALSDMRVKYLYDFGY